MKAKSRFDWIIGAALAGVAIAAFVLLDQPVCVDNPPSYLPGTFLACQP